MGYDLKGYGFVTEDLTADDKDEVVKGLRSLANRDETNKYKDWDSDALKKQLKVDEGGQGVIRDIDDDTVVAIESAPIYYYLVSDNYCYLIKNFNQNIGKWASDTSFLEKMASLLLCIVSPIAGAGYFAANMNNPDWGSGLISIYHEENNIIGLRGSPYQSWEMGSISLDPETKILKVKRGWFNNEVSFKVDGWSGRYGMPLEFLLSVHIATQMPDLAIDIATGFDTDVEMLLHSVDDGFLMPAVKGEDGSMIEFDDMAEKLKEDNGFIKDIWNAGVDAGDNKWFSLWSESKGTAVTYSDRALYELLEMNIGHASGCTCCKHIPGSSSGGECEGETPVEFENTLTKNGVFKDDNHVICEACKTRIQKLFDACRQLYDATWNTYTPYISKVTDHWFRDVYFVTNAAENETGLGFVNVDEEYFYETGERWTIYETWGSGDTIPDGFEVGDYKLYEYDSDNNTYKLYTGSKEDADAIADKIAQGATDVTRLVKKPKSEVYNSEWSAYEKITDTVSDWIKFQVSDSDDTPDALKDSEVTDLIYYKESKPQDIKQVEDGKRAETNAKIKRLFLENKYYKYDGSHTTADKINEDREKTESYRKFDNTENDKRNPDLLTKVSINKDSLGAFTILENTHTLDADYIYRDFKELIVELDYFDKEELSTKIQEVMQWPIPECGSGGWPIRKYEKGETFYGTLINSKVDLDFMKGKDIEKAEQELENTKEEVPTTNKTKATAGKAASGSMADFVEKAYEVHKVMEGNDWHYCIYSNGPHMKKLCGNPNCTLQHCDTLVAGASHTCGLNSTIQEAVAGYHNTCCATYVSWALKEAGFDLSGHPNMHGAKATYDWAEASGFTPITDYSDMEPGDLLFNKSGYNGKEVNEIGHVQILGNDGEWLNAGGVTSINNAPSAYDVQYFIIGMRPPLSGASKPFEGYEPEQAVVAPITGKIVEIGEVERENVETGKNEKVNYIKIQALDHYVTAKEGAYVEEKCTNYDDQYDKENTYDSQKLEGYDYFYEEYKGVIDGCILYIEGFELTNFDGNKSNNISSTYTGEMDTTDITRYTPNIVYNMDDDIIEARSLWKEDAKAAATPFFTDSEGNLYIKEGTVIGKTKEDPELTAEQKEEQKGNGNYIRLILRDLEDSIMEDVETYFNIDNAVKNKCDFEQFAYYLGCLLESFYKEDDLGDSYGVEVLEDGAGNTTAFGLTKAVAETVQSTYPNFAAHLAAGRVPKEEAQDVFILVLEAAKESIQNQLNTPLDDDDSSLFALMDLHHASPSECQKVIQIYNSKNNSLSKEEMISVFTEHWGTNMNYEVALKSRGVNRGVLASEGKFLLYQEGSQGDEVIFDSETPWSEFCDAGGTYEMTLESSGLYHVEKGVYKNYPVSY